MYLSKVFLVRYLSDLIRHIYVILRNFLYFYACNQDVFYDWFDVFMCFCLPKSYEFEDITIKGYLESKKF